MLSVLTSTIEQVFSAAFGFRVGWVGWRVCRREYREGSLEPGCMELKEGLFSCLSTWARWCGFISGLECPDDGEFCLTVYIF